MAEDSFELTPLTQGDARDVFSLWSDEEAVKMTNWPFFTVFEECSARLEKTLKYYSNPAHFGIFAIRDPKHGFIGIAGADGIDSTQKSFDVWYFLKKEIRGRGFAKPALRQLLQRMRESGRVRLATATAVTSNVPSWKTLESQGFLRRETIPGGHTRHGLKLDLFKYEMDLT